MKVNKEFILKNIMTIICGITIVALFFPFIGVSADVGVGGFSANTGDVTFIGYTIISDGGFLGILESVHIKIASKIIAKEITAQKMISSLS